VAGSYHAGSALVDVLPSLRGFQQSIRRELKGINPEVRVPVSPEVANWERKLRKQIGRTPTVEMKVDVNTASLRKAEAEVVAAEKRMAAARDTARDSVARLDIAEKHLGETRANTRAKASQIAAAELKVAQAKRAVAAASNDARNAESALSSARSNVRDIKTSLDVDTTPALAKLRAFAAVGSRAATVNGNVDLDTGAALAKLTALGAAGAGIGTGVAGGVGVASAALVALPALAAAALIPISALVVGLQGVPAVFKAFSDADDQATANVTANAKQQTAAARQIASAQQQVVTAKTGLSRAYQDASFAAASANRRVQDAERSLVAAQRASLQAQRDLTRARDDAVRAMRDLNFEVQGGALAERQAVLDLADAQQELESARSAGASGEALERAQLAYERQLLSLQEIRARNADLTREKAASDRAGVNGSAEVVAAQDRAAQATEGVADAQRGVRDAQDAAAQQQIQSQRAIADAQLQVTQAQLQLSAAIQDSGTVGAAATDKINAAMAKLSPNAREFVTAIRALKPEFLALRTVVQDALFAGLGPAFADFAHRVLPAMATNLGVVATAMNGVTRGMLGFLDTGQTAALFADLFTGIGPVITATSGPLQTFTTLILQLAAAAMPGILALVQAIGHIGIVLQTALQPLIDSGEITQSVTLLARLIGSLAPILATVVTFAVQLMNILGPSLIAVVGSLVPVFEVLSDVLLQAAPHIGRLAGLVAEALLPIMEALAPVVGALIPVIVQLVDAALQILVPLVQAASRVFLALWPAIQPLIPVVLALVAAVLPLISPFLDLAIMILPGIVGLVQLLMPLLVGLAAIFATYYIVGIIGTLIAGLSQALLFLRGVVLGVQVAMWLLNAAFLANPIVLIVALIAGLVAAFIYLWQTSAGFRDFFIGAWRKIQDAVSVAWTNYLKPAFDAIGTALGKVGEFFTGLRDIVAGVWEKIQNAVKGGIQIVIDLVWNNSLRKVYNQAANLMPGWEPLPEIRLAHGGVLPGYAPGRDTIPVLASPGEGWLVPEAVRGLGPEFIAWANHYFSGGRSQGGMNTGGRRFANGGIVTPTPAGASAAVTVDLAAVTGLGNTAAKATEQITTLATAITTVLAPALTALTLHNQTSAAAITASWLQITTTMVLSANTIAARHLLLQTELTARWLAIQTTTWASVTAQGAAMHTLHNGMAATRNAMAFTADWAVTQWARIRAAAADPVRWVLAWPFNAGIIAAWNRLNADFALGKPVAPVPIPFAAGGPVAGPGTGTSDSIRAMLSRGEFVVREKITRRVQPFLEALNSGQAEALQAAGYAGGGIVADTGGQFNAAVARGLAFARAQDGKPYVWGAVGPGAYDCSGLMSALSGVLRGEANPYHRLGVARSQPWPGFIPGLSSAFATGFSQTHTAGTLAGVNVEAGGSPSHAKFGGRAAGADHPQFRGHASLPVVGGRFVPGGGTFDPAALIGPYFADTYRWIGQITTLFASLLAHQSAGVATHGADRVKQAAVSALSALTAVGGVAGSPEVVSAVRAVAATFGWGTGPQWDALSWLIQRESSWNPAAANPRSSARGLFQKMISIHGPLEPTVTGQAQWGLGYIKCVPLDAQILTRDGWKSHSDVEVGDETLGYDPITGMSHWTKITAVHHYGDASVVRVGNAHWSARCTPNHRWVAEKLNQLPDGSSYRRDEMVETQYIGTRHRVRVSALVADAPCGARLPITSDEAELLGWVLGDGCLYYGLNNRGGKRGKFNMSVYQSDAKPHHLARLRELLANIPHSEYRAGGNHWSKHGRSIFRLRSAYARDLLARSGYEVDLEAMVRRMSAEQRTSFINGVHGADGYQDPRGRSRMIAQNEGPKLDAIVLALYMQGYHPHLTDSAQQKHVTFRRPFVKPVVRDEDAGVEPVWCVTTELGSWTMRQDGQIMLTGNSRYRDPIGARAWHQAHNWYDQGGVARGTGLLPKGVVEPERVLSPAQTRSFDRLVAHIGTGRNLPTTGGATDGGQFTGQLYLDSGEFLGMVRGEINDAGDATAAALLRGRRI
jgi:phage-related protein